MRKKVRKVLAFLLAIAVAVSVTTGMALSASSGSDADPASSVTAEDVEEELTDVNTPTTQAEDADEPAQEEETPDAEPASDEEDQADAEEPASAGEALDQTATVGSGDKTVTVRTTAAAGVLPEGAKLVVKQLADTDSQYQDAADQLDASKIAYDGFLALDVGFEVDGKEVEPDGSVDVQFKLGTGLLPEEADADSLAVQHLAGTGEVETVADASIAVKNQAVKADFTVDSFSTFVMTWNKYFSVRVHYVDEDGNEIGQVDSAGSAIELQQGDNDLEKYKKTFDGYEYVDIRYNTYTDTGDNSITKVRVTNNTGRGNKTKVLTFYNGNEVVATKTVNENADPVAAEVYIVYRATGGSGDSAGTVTEPTVTRNKYVEYNEDNDTYNLNLTVSSTIGSVETPAMLDVILVLDRSGSMSSDNLLANIKSASSEFIDVLEAKQNGKQVRDVRYSVISFAGNYYDDGYDYPHLPGEHDATIDVSWGSGTAAKTAINQLKASGGTNYQAAIRETKTQLINARNGATTVVVFFTDGEPTYYIGGGTGSNDDNAQTCLKNALNEAAGLSCSYFYCVGTGSAVNNNLQQLTEKVNAGTKGTMTVSSNNLEDTFKEIGASVTSISCTNVVITDPLSKYAEIVDSNALTITVKQGDKVIAGPEKSVTIEGATLTPTYDANTRTITLKFPEEYTLNKDYTYIVTAPIEASNEAYTEFAKNGYSSTGDVGTGTTSAKEDGFYSNENENAKVTYNVSNDATQKTVLYQKPVIQVKTGTLVIEKTISGLSNDEIAGLENSLTFNYTLNSGTEQSVKLSDFTPGEGGKYTYTVTGLSPKTSYTVTENTTTANVKGYDLSGTHEAVSGTVNKDTQTASFTNDYELSNRTITLKKVVSGNMGDTNKEFTFSVSSVSNSATIGEDTLKHNETTTITAKVGDTVTITETDSGDGYTTSAAGITGGTYSDETKSYSFTVTKDMTTGTVVTFTNTKHVEVPNGINSNFVPYVMMVVVAAGAGVFFVMRRRPRGRHER